MARRRASGPRSSARKERVSCGVDRAWTSRKRPTCPLDRAQPASKANTNAAAVAQPRGLRSSHRIERSRRAISRFSPASPDTPGRWTPGRRSAASARTARAYVWRLPVAQGRGHAVGGELRRAFARAPQHPEPADSTSRSPTPSWRRAAPTRRAAAGGRARAAGRPRAAGHSRSTSGPRAASRHPPPRRQATRGPSSSPDQRATGARLEPDFPRQPRHQVLHVRGHRRQLFW